MNLSNPTGLLAELSDGDQSSPDEDVVMPTVNIYREGLKAVVERSRTFTGWTTASVKVMLVTSAYVPSQLHSSKADVSTFEIQPSGDYVTGGQLIAVKTITTVNNQLRLDGEDMLWTNLVIKPRYAVVYDDTNTVASTKTLFAYMDLGNLKSKRLRIKWPSTGVLVYTTEDAIGLP